MINSRSKGATGERELFALLSERLGTVVRRNLAQSRAGGADSVDVPGFAIEVKRCETESIVAWTDQAIEQAQRMEAANPGSRVRPILFYRRSRQPWRARVDMNELNPEAFPNRFVCFATLEFDAAVQWMREVCATSTRT